jgi:hypothetical protein
MILLSFIFRSQKMVSFHLKCDMQCIFLLLLSFVLNDNAKESASYGSVLRTIKHAFHPVTWSNSCCISKHTKMLFRWWIFTLHLLIIYIEVKGVLDTIDTLQVIVRDFVCNFLLHFKVCLIFAVWPSNWMECMFY